LSQKQVQYSSHIYHIQKGSE